MSNTTDNNTNGKLTKALGDTHLPGSRNDEPVSVRHHPWDSSKSYLSKAFVNLPLVFLSVANFQIDLIWIN